MLRRLKKILPESLYHRLQTIFHLSVAFLSAVYYHFPSRELKVVAITGTKGKTTSTELVSALLEAGGHKTAIISTVRFKIGEQSRRNLLKMTTPGRGLIQKLLREAVSAGCDYAVLELSSEGAKQYRHAFIDLDALIFTNLSPEHIESHGGYDKYVAAKLAIAKSLATSPKRNKVLVVNGDDTEAAKFLAFPIETKKIFTVNDCAHYELSDQQTTFTYHQKNFTTPLLGLFNLYNILGALTYVQTQAVSLDQCQQALTKFAGVPGRMQKIVNTKKPDQQDFEVVVDYAHTAESLRAAYTVYKDRRLICVFGSTGGGRDKWKRPAMGQVANEYCSEIILTNDDPYDEDPDQIVCDIAKGIEKPYDIIIDRREAIKEAVRRAQTGDVVMLTGKGTDPYLMLADGQKLPWSDADFAQAELNKRFSN